MKRKIQMNEIILFYLPLMRSFQHEMTALKIK
jgi:hypothetical protein